MSVIIKVLSFLRLFFITFVVLAFAVGISGNLIQHKDNENFALRPFARHFGKDFASYYTKGPMRCMGEDMRSRLEDIGAVAVFTVLLQGFVWLLALVELVMGYYPFLFKVSVFYHVSALVFALVTFAMTAHFYRRSFCNEAFIASRDGFSVGYGLALFAAGWVVQLVCVTICLVALPFALKKGVNGDKKADDEEMENEKGSVGTENEPTAENKEPAVVYKEEEPAKAEEPAAKTEEESAETTA